MSDGRIVYEVRVDSNSIDSDLSRAGSILDKGNRELTRLAMNNAQNFGKIFGDVFNVFGRGALNALTPVANLLGGLSKINLSNISSVVGKSVSGVTQNTPAPAASSGAVLGASRSALPSFAVGTDFIPYDDFPALLHKGEAVLTASENAALKAAGGIGAMREAQPVIIKNENDGMSADGFGRRPVEVMLKIGDYEFTQIIANTMNDLYRQWGTNPLK
jgi:hypothetical protein